MPHSKRIFIIGTSGAGKGVLAQAVAKKLGWKFINADILGSVGCLGRTCTQVLGDAGEQHFLECLTDILTHQLTLDHIVVTTDESIIASERACELLQSEFTVFVSVSPDVQVSRLEGYRPLLPVDDYQAVLEQYAEQHRNLYESVASTTLNSDDGDIANHVHQIIAAYNS